MHYAEFLDKGMKFWLARFNGTDGIPLPGDYVA